MSGYRLAAVAFVAALVGGLVGGIVAVEVGGSGEDERQRGMVVRLGDELGFEDGLWCSPHHRFCIPEFEKPEEARAFYMVDTGATTRARACPVEWRLDLDVARFADEETAERLGPGLFRALCSGTTWLRAGELAFGPGPRNLDEFAITHHTEMRDIEGEEIEVSWFEVDTRELICGEYAPGATDRGCELAPPFD